MILLEEESAQRPKLPSDPIASSPVSREPVQPDFNIPGPSSRPPSPSPTLPDYETSEAQHLLYHKRGGGRRFLNTRLGKVVWYALVVYSSLFIVAGVPFVVVRWRSSRGFRWHADDTFYDYGPTLPSPRPPSGQIDLYLPPIGESSVVCNTWDELSSYTGKHGMTAGTASLRLAFPLGDEIALRANTSADEHGVNVTGKLTVGMNPDRTESDVVFRVKTQYSHQHLFEASSVCLFSVGNATELSVLVPSNRKDPSDAVDFNLQLLLPWTATPIYFERFTTHLPMFEQTFSNLGAVATFESLKIEGPGSLVTVGSVTATSILVRTSGANITGTFSATERLILDTINGAIYANVSLLNSKKLKKPTKLSMETGNEPIVANVFLDVDERIYFLPPTYPNFQTKFKTFSAPMNISIAHVEDSKPARLGVFAENTQGTIDLALDHLYTGTFDLRTKAATASVKETIIYDEPDAAGYRTEDEDEERELQLDHVSSEWTLGWIGSGRRPDDSDRYKQGHVELTNSLSPIDLRLAQTRPLTVVRR
ncbi:hypothetical protein BC834DRAFT_113583 [Gloeopeniophorella convolvens]|nr:hypothetical protein BC834DRAFT_113583 [Gloeopeniophorella convolvens]